MTQEEKKQLQEIREHLAELHHRWSTDKSADLHHKSNEGYVGVIAMYPNWFECSNKEEYINAIPKYHVEVYSYLFGKYRLHEFKNISQANKEVMSWEYEED